MNMRLLTVILFSFVLSSVAEAIDASVQYRPGDNKSDYRRYRPASPESVQSSSPHQTVDHYGSATVPQVTSNINGTKPNGEGLKQGKNNLCERQKVIAEISKEEVNRIAYKGMKAFSKACEIKREVAVLCNDNGEVLRYEWGDEYGVPGGMKLDSSALLHIHNHPFDEQEGEYHLWPSYADVESAILVQLLFGAYMEKIGCKDNGGQARKVYNYIVACSWENKPSNLIRYDENGVFRINANGSEEKLHPPGFVNDASIQWPEKKNRPFRFHAEDLAMAREDARREQAKKRMVNSFSTAEVGSSKCWCCRSKVVDFTALVPDKIWTEPIIGALVEGVREESGRAIPGKEVDWRKQGVDWWGAKWMGKRFHMNIPYDEHGESPYHLFGFFINSGIACPYVYSAPISEFSLDDAFKLEGKVKKMIEDNTGIKLICEKNDFKQTYNHKYRFDSMYCRIFFDSNIEIRGMYVNDKKALAGKVWKEKSLISIKMSFGVGLSDCMYWHEYQKKFDSKKYSVRDLLQGKVKTK